MVRKCYSGDDVLRLLGEIELHVASGQDDGRHVGIPDVRA